METILKLEILPQPNNTTCGPTSLHAVYGYYGDHLPLEQVIQEVGQLAEGGTLAVVLGCHALKRGYEAKLYTFDLLVFDPTWFRPNGPPLQERLIAQMAAKDIPKLHVASRAYMDFLEFGGKIRMHDLDSGLVLKYLKRSVPILTGLNSTYLYQETREYGPTLEPDDIRGYSTGHFVVLCGYDTVNRAVLVADPLMPNPMAHEHIYVVGLDRLKCAILLGIVTYDANLLIIQPRKQHRGRQGVGSDRRE